MTPADGIERLDRAVARACARLRGSPLDGAFRLASGRRARLAAGASMAAAACGATRSAAPLQAAVAASLGAQLAAVAVRPLVGRPRPPQEEPGLRPAAETPSTSSFPSSHAASAFALAAALAPALPGLERALRTAAGVTAFSRVWLGVHHASDVVAGAALGHLVGRWVARETGLSRRR